MFYSDKGALFRKKTGHGNSKKKVKEELEVKSGPMRDRPGDCMPEVRMYQLLLGRFGLIHIKLKEGPGVSHVLKRCERAGLFLCQADKMQLQEEHGLVGDPTRCTEIPRP
jgi:hypothetical protein